MVDAKEILEFCFEQAKTYEEKLSSDYVTEGGETVDKAHLDAHIRVLKTFGEEIDEEWYEEIQQELDHF